MAAAIEVPPRGMMPASMASRLWVKAPKEGRPRESYEADTVAAELCQEILHCELGAREPVRFDVGREHAARGVDRDQQIDALALHLLPAEAPHRAAEGHRERQHGAAEQRGPNGAAARVEVGCYRRQQGGGDEGLERLAAPAQAPQQKERERRHQHEGGETHGIAPLDHGSFLSTVSPSPISASSNANAGHSSHG